MRILIINGPNINMLGTREPEIYGTTTLQKLNEELTTVAQELGVEVDFFQSNSEGDIVTKIQAAKSVYDGLIINPAAYTHTSIAIADALTAVKIPAVEVHLSNIYSREEYRRHSLTAPACIGQISGFGMLSYKLALNAITSTLSP